MINITYAKLKLAINIFNIDATRTTLKMKKTKYSLSQDMTTKTYSKAFTIVELLVVIVVMGILAAITVVSYSGITKRAKEVSIQSDLSSNSNKLKNYYTLYDSYPITMDSNNCPLTPVADTNYCLDSSGDSSIVYSSIIPTTFRLSNTDSDLSYSITDTTAISPVTTQSSSTTGLSCPNNFIPVPGSGTYGTNDFCVMKYEAKNNGSGVAVSQPEELPWVNISQTSAMSVSSTACTGCHLVTEAEWMTIVQNVISVASNWSTGIVGDGYIYSGHNDDAPSLALAADPAGIDGYFGVTNKGGDQRRTLSLTNGEEIWDISGNVNDWTSGQITGNQPGNDTTYQFLQGNNWRYTLLKGEPEIDPFPWYAEPKSVINWSGDNGIGYLISNIHDTELRGFVRGGRWNDSSAGVATLGIYYSPDTSNAYTGFRVAR